MIFNHTQPYLFQISVLNRDLNIVPGMNIVPEELEDAFMERPGIEDKFESGVFVKMTSPTKKEGHVQADKAKPISIQDTSVNPGLVKPTSEQKNELLTKQAQEILDISETKKAVRIVEGVGDIHLLRKIEAIADKREVITAAREAIKKITDHRS